MPKLERLEMSSNKLSGEEIASTIVSLYPDLVTLKLSGNQIEDVAHVKAFGKLQKLESLDLSGNPFCAKVSTEKI